MVDIVLGLVGTAMLGTVGWLFASVVETKKKVAVLEEDLKSFLPELLDTKLEHVIYRLERIEKAMNGNLKGH